MSYFSPDAKIIYILRHPIERLASIYVHNMKMGRVHGTLADYYSVDRTSDILTSFYYYQLSQYIKYFPQNNILILNYDELIARPKQAILDVLKFLHIPKSHYSPLTTYKIFNATTKSAKLDTKDARFRKNTYQSIYNALSTDVQRLKKCGIDFKWDISPERWVAKDKQLIFDAFPSIGNLYLKIKPSKELFLKFLKKGTDRVSVGGLLF